MASEALFTKLNFICSLLMGPVSQSVALHLAGKASHGKNKVL
jgi:hypothetical protein